MTGLLVPEHLAEVAHIHSLPKGFAHVEVLGLVFRFFAGAGTGPDCGEFR